MEPRSDLWLGLDPHSTDGLDVVTLGLCPGPFPAAPGVGGAGACSSVILLRAASSLQPVVLFPGAVIHSWGVSEAAEDEGTELVLRDGAPQAGNAGGKWEFVSRPCFQCGRWFCSPSATGGPQHCSQRGLTSLPVHHKALLKPVLTGEAMWDVL